MVKKNRFRKNVLFVLTYFAFANFIDMPAPSSVGSSRSPRRNVLVRLVVVAVFE